MIVPSPFDQRRQAEPREHQGAVKLTAIWRAIWSGSAPANCDGRPSPALLIRTSMPAEPRDGLPGEPARRLGIGQVGGDRGHAEPGIECTQFVGQAVEPLGPAGRQHHGRVRRPPGQLPRQRRPDARPTRR